MQNELEEEKQIKNAVIDLLHHGKEVNDTSLSESTGISIERLKQHHDSIQTMLNRLKKMRTPNSI